MFNKKQKSIVRKQLRNHFGHCNLGEIRKYLKSKSVDQYGCFYYQEKIGGGMEISYTSNPNCFASVLLNVKMVGFTSQYGLTKKDLTKAGLLRGCGDYYAL